MNFVVAIYCALLFYVLSPGVFLRLPTNGSKMMVTAVHAAIFGAILYFTQKTVWKMSVGLEGNTGMTEDDKKKAVAAATM